MADTPDRFRSSGIAQHDLMTGFHRNRSNGLCHSTRAYDPGHLCSFRAYGVHLSSTRQGFRLHRLLASEDKEAHQREAPSRDCAIESDPADAMRQRVAGRVRA